MSTDTKTTIDIGSPDIELSVKEIFGLDTDLKVPAYSKTKLSQYWQMQNGRLFMINIPSCDPSCRTPKENNNL